MSRKERYQEPVLEKLGSFETLPVINLTQHDFVYFNILKAFPYCCKEGSLYQIQDTLILDFAASSIVFVSNDTNISYWLVMLAIDAIIAIFEVHQ